MTRANTEQLKYTPWFAKAGAACSIVPIARFVNDRIFALKSGGYGCLFSLAGLDEESLTDQELEAQMRSIEGALRGLPEGACLYEYTRVMSGFILPRKDHYMNPVAQVFVDDRLAFLEKTAGFRRIDLHWCLTLEPPKAAAFTRKPKEHTADTTRMLVDLEKTATLLDLTEAETPPQVRAGLLQSTLIVLPAEEKVANVFAGDTVDWVFDGGHVASRFISVKPRTANASTDIHIVSDRGNEYTLQLREVSNDPDSHFDSKVFINPGDQTAKDRLTQLPVFVPAAELDKAKQEAAAAKAAQTAELKAEQTKTEQYHSEYPGTLHFDYAWDEKKGKELGLQQIWRDDKFTYLRGVFQETPALYELKDKKGSLVNFDFNGGLYTVPKLLENGYLAIGKQKVEFHRLGGTK